MKRPSRRCAEIAQASQPVPKNYPAAASRGNNSPAQISRHDTNAQVRRQGLRRLRRAPVAAMLMMRTTAARS